ncbi:MAG: GNAT family N-acetyltransferase [Kofleriaceae bacterium]
MIETERLQLRRPTLADFEASAAMWADPEVTRFIGNKPQTREQSWARLLRYAGHWELLGYGFLFAYERTSQRFVGEVGIGNFERDIEPSLGPHEAGWVLAAWAHGQGFATEALRAILAWFDARFPATPTRCIIDVANAASQKVAAKLGYRELDRRTYHDEPVIVFER